jgi:tetratricopeptide (TPR) repeat protein
MKQFLVFNFFLFSFFIATAQTPDAKELQATAKKFMQQGDYDNATLVLKNAVQADPKNLDLLKDWEFLHFLKRDYAKAMEIGKPLIERPDADEQTFQILGMTYKGIAEYDECYKLYKQAVKKFPKSGVLYNEWGEAYAMNKKMSDAIVNWEKGIEVDPNYSSNYYNAAMYYSRNNEVFWQLIYGEIFLNLESFTARSADIKTLLLDDYKKLYMLGDFTKINTKNVFEKAVLETLSKSVSLTREGVTPSVLAAIRTRFVLDWYNAKNNEKFPFRLFDQQQYLLREGMFDAYSQWIFGAAASPATYQTWLDANEKQGKSFKDFQSGRVFKLVAGQYYHYSKSLFIAL